MTPSDDGDADPSWRSPATKALAGLELVDVLDGLGHSVVVVAARDDLPIVYVNAAFEATTGWPAEQVLGRNCRVLQGDLLDDDARARFRQLLASGRPGTVLIANQHPDGEVFFNEVAVSSVRADGAITHYVGVQTDVTARIEAQRHVQTLAERDGLTGAFNRRHLDRWLKRRARDPDAAAALIYVDVDAFKAINDSLGHDGGDELLRQLTERLLAMVRPTDLLARVGGDEFVIAMDLATDPDGAELAAARVLEATRAPFDLGGGAHPVTVSVGVSHSRTAGSALLQAADEAMYRAKRGGGDAWAVAGADPASAP